MGAVLDIIFLTFALGFYALRFLYRGVCEIDRKISPIGNYDREARVAKQMRMEPSEWEKEEQHIRDLLEYGWENEDHPTTPIYKEMKEDFDFIFEQHYDPIATNTDEKLANFYRGLYEKEKENFIDWCTLLRVARRGKGYYLWHFTDLRPNFAPDNIPLSFRACHRVEVLWRECGIDFHMVYDPLADGWVKPTTKIFPEELRHCGHTRRIFL